MGEYSEKFKDIILSVFLGYDLNNVMETYLILSNPSEKSIVKSIISTHRYWFNGSSIPEKQFEETQQILKEADRIYKIYFSILQLVYFQGLYETILNKHKVEELHDQLNRLMDEIQKDTWEYHYLQGYLKSTKAIQMIKQGEVENAIHIQEEAINHFNKITKLKYYSNLGLYYQAAGRFEDAEEQYKGQWERTKELLLEKAEVGFTTLGNLLSLLHLQGKLNEMEYFINEGLEVAEISENISLLSQILSYRSSLYRSQGLYDQAESDLIRIHEVVDNPGALVNAYSQLIQFYEDQFTLTNDRSVLETAWNWLDKFESHPNLIEVRQWWRDIFHLNQAILLSHGNFREKGQAMELLEDLLDKDPTNWRYLMSYLRLLFEEMKVTGIEETNQKIKETIDQIAKIPLQQNPKAITNYTSQQLLLAKYYFHIDGDVDKALDILYLLENILDEYGLSHLKSHVIADRQGYENEVLKWQNTKMSTRERIIHSNIQNYIDLTRKTIGVQDSGNF